MTSHLSDEKAETKHYPQEYVKEMKACFSEKGIKYHMCRVQNEEKGEDGKDRILLIAGEGVTCLVQSHIFTDSLQFTNVGDVLENDQLSIERGSEVSWLNPVMVEVGHSDAVVCSKVEIMEQENV